MAKVTREQVCKALAKHYSNKMKGKVWAGYDASKRSYYIRGDNLPAHPDLRELYPSGWSLLDYIKPSQARKVKIT